MLSFYKLSAFFFSVYIFVEMSPFSLNLLLVSFSWFIYLFLKLINYFLIYFFILLFIPHTSFSSFFSLRYDSTPPFPFSSVPPSFLHLTRRNEKERKRAKWNENSCDVMAHPSCLQCFLSPSCPPLLSLFLSSPAHTLPNLDTGQVGGVYHSVMSLMDSVMSVMDSWDCRKKEECCPQCSCLVCRNPRFL